MARVTKPWRVMRLGTGIPARERPDVLAGEEPLEIRIGGEPLTVTMRTPGSDFELVAGFLVGEGVITRREQIRTMDYRSGIGADGYRDYNVIDVKLADGVTPPAASQQRQVYTSSSCGVCGTASIETVQKESAYPVAGDRGAVTLAELLALPGRLQEEQRVFDKTGGVHAAGLLVDQNLACVREDVGRHNAVDKVIGWGLLDGRLPLTGSVLQVSSRASFELVQKCAMAGIPVLSAVSAPSALAVELAADVGVTVVGFNRGDTLNVYTRGDRVIE